MRVVTIIQARTTSGRLPNKVMLDIYGKPLLERVINQALRIKNSDVVWVATSTHPNDDVIEILCSRKQIPCYRGSLEDVRSRYFAVAEQEKADIVVRVTADNPLTEPRYTDQIITGLKNNPGIHYGRMKKASILDGTGSEGFTFSALKSAMTAYTGDEDREHVTPSILKNRELLELTPDHENLSAKNPYFLGVDSFDDYKRLNILFQKFDDGSDGKDVLTKIIKRINNDEKII